MKTLHRWFRSGRDWLLSHVDLPEKQCERTGVLIVPPFGWEDICSYRPLRFVAQRLSAAGFPTLRFDLPATGDSSGDAADPALLEAWIQSVADAAAELKAAAGVEEVACAGVRLGAMLALLAASRGAGLADLLLWSPSPTGRALLRELRAFANLQMREYGDEPQPPATDGFEVGGFLLSPETQSALESIDLTSLPPMPGKRVLLLTRDQLPPDAKLVHALQQSRCDIHIRPGEGYSTMVAVPHEALPPGQTAAEMIRFLERASAPVETTTPSARVAIAAVADGVRETIYTVADGASSLFGILAEPGPKTQRKPHCALFLNPGATRHIGPNRMWVDAARRWAARGVVSLRIDLAGIGESDGEPVLDVAALYQDRLVEQVELVLASLRSRLGIRTFAAIGLCSGAFWALHAAARNPELVSVLLLNPRLFLWDPEVDRLRALRRTIKGITSWTDWRRVARGEIKAADVRRIALEGFRARRADSIRPFEAQMEALAAAKLQLARHRSRATIVFSEGEPLLQEMLEFGALPAENGACVRCLRVPNGGHTFRPRWIQALAHQLIDREIETALASLHPEFVAEAP